MIKEKDRVKLIERIKSIESKDVLDEVYRLLEVEFDDSIYVTNKDQKIEISEGMEEISEGKGIDSHTADGEIDTWLGK